MWLLWPSKFNYEMCHCRAFVAQRGKGGTKVYVVLKMQYIPFKNQLVNSLLSKSMIFSKGNDLSLQKLIFILMRSSLSPQHFALKVSFCRVFH